MIKNCFYIVTLFFFLLNPFSGFSQETPSIDIVFFDEGATYSPGSGVSLHIFPRGVYKIDDLNMDGEVDEVEINSAQNNSFILELSDNSGSFNNAQIIATYNGFFTPLINANLPDDLISGSYKLRVRATHGQNFDAEFNETGTSEVISVETGFFVVDSNSSSNNDIFVSSGMPTNNDTFTCADGSNSGYTTAAEIYGSCDGGSGSAGDMPGRITFHTRPDGAGQSMQERLRIDSRGDVYFSESTPLSSPNPAYRRISIANNLILNANASAGGYTGFQNNAYINSSGNWVRVNNDFASSIGMDDGVLYFRNVGAGTGNISWSTPMTIYPNGTTTMNTTITLNGQIISSGASGRGGKFGNIQIGFGALNNTVQNIVANTPLHLQYDNSGDVRVNEGGGDMQTRDIFPESNNSYSLGTDAKRWSNIHTNDLNLSNEGSKNDVDGTWGQYTICLLYTSPSPRDS